MRIRHDVVFISSVLFTISLLWLVPWCWRDTLESGGVLGVMSRGRHDVHLQSLDASERIAYQAMGDLGIASLTIISIGLIVTWMGYVKRLRWTWFVLLVIVWGWAYPLLSIRLLIFNLSVRWVIELFRGAIYDQYPSTPRVLLETMLIFTLMLLALILPISSFLKNGRPDRAKAH
jgi:hypothetical protein